MSPPSQSPSQPTNPTPSTSAAPTNATPSTSTAPEVEIVATLRVDGGGRVDSIAEYLELTAITRDDTEAGLIESLRDLNSHVGFHCGTAVKLDHPGVIAKHTKMAIQSLRAMMKVLQALHRHRHGSIQRIQVHRAKEPPPPLDTDLARSDRLLREMFLDSVTMLSFVRDRCKRQRIYLDGLSQVQLSGEYPGLRPGPDRRDWSAKFRDLEDLILAKRSEFRSKDVLSMPKEHVVLVRQTTAKSRARRIKKKKIATTAKKFAIAANVEKARGPD